MSGDKALLDSNIIIYLSKNILNIDDLFNEYNEFYISINDWFKKRENY